MPQFIQAVIERNKSDGSVFNDTFPVTFIIAYNKRSLIETNHDHDSHFDYPVSYSRNRKRRKIGMTTQTNWQHISYTAHIQHHDIHK